MDFKNKNLLNIFNPAKVTNESLTLTILAFLPAAFVAKTIESTLIYLLLMLMFLILTTLVSKLLNVVQKENGFIINSVSFVIVAVFISLLSGAFFINFTKEFNIYIVLMSIGSLPYMLRADNEDKSVDKSILNTLKSFIGFALIMLIIALFREVLGTGMITFGNYTSIKFSVDLFKKYALTILSNPLGSFIILGFIAAYIKSKEEKQWL